MESILEDGTNPLSNLCKKLNNLCGEKNHKFISYQGKLSSAIPGDTCWLIIGEGLEEEEKQVIAALKNAERRFGECIDLETLIKAHNLKREGGVIKGICSTLNFMMRNLEEANRPAESCLTKQEVDVLKYKDKTSLLANFYGMEKVKLNFSHKHSLTPIKKGQKALVVDERMYDEAENFIKDKEFISSLKKMRDKKPKDSITVYVVASGDLVFINKKYITKG